MRRIISLLILTGIATFSLYAQELRTLDQSLEIAIEKNFGIQMAENNAEIAKNNAIPGNSGLMPRLNLTSGVTYNDNLVPTEIGDNTQQYTLNNTGINLSYTIFDGLASIHSYKILKKNAEAGDLQLQRTIENTLLQVVSSYYSVAMSYESVKISQEKLKVSKERLDRAKIGKEFGGKSGLEILNAKVDFNNDSLDLVNALNTYGQSKRNLNVILGLAPETAFEISTQIQDFVVFDKEELRQKAKNKNVSIQLSNNQYEQAELDLKAAQSAISPKISLQSSYGYNQTANQFAYDYSNPNKNFSAGVTLSFNIFDGFRTKTQKQNSKIYLDNARLSNEEELLNLDKNIENAWANYKNDLLVFNTEKNNLQSYELNFEQTREYFRLGQVTSTQFREAQLNLSSAKMSIALAKYSAKLSEIELIYISGGLLKN